MQSTIAASAGTRHAEHHRRVCPGELLCRDGCGAVEFLGALSLLLLFVGTVIAELVDDLPGLEGASHFHEVA